MVEKLALLNLDQKGSNPTRGGVQVVTMNLHCTKPFGMPCFSLREFHYHLPHYYYIKVGLGGIVFPYVSYD